MFLIRRTVSKNMYVHLPRLPECSKDNFDSELTRSLREIKALALEK